jgi:hypothetical protein
MRGNYFSLKPPYIGGWKVTQLFNGFRPAGFSMYCRRLSQNFLFFLERQLLVELQSGAYHWHLYAGSGQEYEVGTATPCDNKLYEQHHM